ncbi:MAG TPA: prenyltransferase/squalene oxidase repeat-containing protein [Vicinamibacterales bacterium]|nr:prenyltransferase/squalene oxidase repeat-containing protein [Vicinamibacterales bacterium]
MQSVARSDAIDVLIDRLLTRRAARDHWDGSLASSALATGTAVLALGIAVRNGYPDAARLAPLVNAGVSWLVNHQNPDGGWGDTVISKSNISTTAIVWATLSDVAGREPAAGPAVQQSEAWLRRAAGDTSPESLRMAILRRYGTDKTFSVPILTVLALTGKLGAEARHSWRSVPQLPFELAALPHAWFQHLRLPVVSYALPALIAIGQVRHHFRPSRNPVTRVLRDRVRSTTHDLLHAMQPDSGGYLEATPLTSFVVMSLAGMRRTDSPVVQSGIRFLIDSMRDDGSWPIDTNLSTWVTTLSIDALGAAGALPDEDVRAMREWLLAQQSRREHPFTHAAPGAWAWTPLSGGVPDADDTSGALLALRRLGDPDAGTVSAAAAGIRWLLDVQNRDGGIPTFCRGWGALPFDRSTPEITAHALRAWSEWIDYVDGPLQRRIDASARRAVKFLVRSQRQDGSWIPLWFGNESAAREDNPTYGTARVIRGLQSSLARDDTDAARCLQRGAAWLLKCQNSDGGWGGDIGAPSSVEETGVALEALGRAVGAHDANRDALKRGLEWLTAAAKGECGASPVGLYFARLWYFEELYPLIFALGGIAAVARRARRLGPRRVTASVPGPGTT